MATKKEIDSMLAVDQNRESQMQQEITSIAVQGSEQPEVKYTIFKLVKPKRRGNVHIDGTDDVINPKTGKQERIRLLAGVSTIWMSEQMEQKIAPEYISQNKRSLKFMRGGIVLIPNWDTAALEFAQVCNSNIGNPKRKKGTTWEFFEYNPQKQAEEAMKRDMLGLDMAIKAREMSEEDVRKYASFIKVVFYDEYQQPKPPEALRRELMLYASKFPEKFNEMTGDKQAEVNLQFMVKNAIISNKIDLGNLPDVRFGTGQFICKLPPGAQPLQYLTDLGSTNSEEGKSFKEQLSKLK